MEADILNVPNIILRKKIILTLFEKKHGLSFINVAVEKPQRNAKTKGKTFTLAKTWAKTLFLVQIIALPTCNGGNHYS